MKNSVWSWRWWRYRILCLVYNGRNLYHGVLAEYRRRDFLTTYCELTATLRSAEDMWSELTPEEDRSPWSMSLGVKIIHAQRLAERLRDQCRW